MDQSAPNSSSYFIVTKKHRNGEECGDRDTRQSYRHAICCIVFRSGGEKRTEAVAVVVGRRRDGKDGMGRRRDAFFPRSKAMSVIFRPRTGGTGTSATVQALSGERQRWSARRTKKNGQELRRDLPMEYKLVSTILSRVRSNRLRIRVVCIFDGVYTYI